MSSCWVKQGYKKENQGPFLKGKNHHSSDKTCTLCLGCKPPNQWSLLESFIQITQALQAAHTHPHIVQLNKGSIGINSQTHTNEWQRHLCASALSGTRWLDNWQDQLRTDTLLKQTNKSRWLWIADYPHCWLEWAQPEKCNECSSLSTVTRSWRGSAFSGHFSPCHSRTQHSAALQIVSCPRLCFSFILLQYSRSKSPHTKLHRTQYGTPAGNSNRWAMSTDLTLLWVPSQQHCTDVQGCSLSLVAIRRQEVG